MAQIAWRGRWLQFDTEIIIGQHFPSRWAWLFPEHVYLAPNELLAERAPMRRVQHEQPLAARLLHLIRNLILHTRRSRALARGKAKDMRLGKAHLISLLRRCALPRRMSFAFPRARARLRRV